MFAASTRRRTGNASAKLRSDNTNALRFFKEDSMGLKVSPKAVLITSLIYVGVVVILHIWSKMMRGESTLEGETGTGSDL